MDDGTRSLVDGRAAAIRFDERESVVWWGTDGDFDRLATHEGRILTWPTARAARSHAHEAGWDTDGPVDDRAPDPEDVTDCRPVQAWLRRPGTALDHRSALGLWNLSWDITASTTGAYPVLDRARSRCHTELTVACVPWLAGHSTYRPRWSAADLRCLRATLTGALHALRTALPSTV